MHFNQFNCLGTPDIQSIERIRDDKMENGTLRVPESLYHVLLQTSHFAHDPNGAVEKVRVVGSYDCVKHAKAAAHSCLFDAGYHREWFDTYETSPEYFEKHEIPQRDGLAVYAVATNAVTFRVRILTTSNTGKFSTEYEDGRIPNALYHVIQTNVEYNVNENGEVRDTSIQGSFGTYREARDLAKTTLLSEEDGITWESFAQYDEAKPGERDCGYGENVIVHAVGNNGENTLVSIVIGHELESVRLAEAAMRMR